MPNPFQMLVSQMLGQASRGFQHDDPQATFAVRMIGRFQEHLFGRWHMAQSTQLPCAVSFQNFHTGQVTPCHQPMAGTCAVCSQPCCLDHASVLIESGDLVCFGCIELAKQAHAGGATAGPHRQQAPPRGPNPEDQRKLRRKYLRLLKLKGEPTEDEIRAAYRREAAKAHPDKHPEDKKDQAHKRFVELGAARDFLIAQCQRRAA